MKNMCRLWTSFLFVVLFSAAFSIMVLANSSLSVSLEEVGTIPARSFDYESFDIYPTGLIAYNENGNYFVLDEMGNNNLNRSYGNAEYFTDELFLVRDQQTWPNSCGLVKSDGTVVLPCEAAIIETIDGTDRYLKISVATEKTDKDAAFLYTYSGWVAWPSEQSEYYDGYSKYYDLQEGQYFDDWADADLSDFHGKYTYESGEKGTTILLGPDGNPVAELDFWPSAVYGEGERFAKRTDNGVLVVDQNGDPISDIQFKASPTETNGYLWAVNSNDENENTVIDFDGNVYADASDNIWNVLDKDYGFTLLYNRDENSLLLYPDGTTAALGHFSGDGDLPFHRGGEDGEPNKIFVLNEGEYRDIKEEYLSNGGKCGKNSCLLIMAKHDDDQEFSLYSAADGSLLLDKGGTSLRYSDYWAYALNDDNWTIYKVTVS